MPSNELIPTILIPMAGMGSRFSQAGYKDPKPLIPIFGLPMVEHVINSVGLYANWIFIVQKEHREKYNIDEILNRNKPDCTIIDTGGGVTQGAACSVLLAKEYINNDNPLVIVNSDNIIHWNTGLFYDNIAYGNADGLILTFEDTDPRWSFAKLDNRNEYVTEVAEKKPISTHATAGMYIWKYGKDFVTDAETMIAKNIRVNNEFYVAPVYNESIARGKKIIIGQVNKMDGVGTPEELGRYIDNELKNRLGN